VTLQLGTAGESHWAQVTPELPLLVEQHVSAVVVLPHALLAHAAHLQRGIREILVSDPDPNL
jgi:hypothetical protein